MSEPEIETLKSCPHCRVPMEKGFVLDRTHGANLAAEWYEGEPVRSFWTGLKLSGKAHFKIRSYRCPRCGYLESYAP